MSHLETLLSVLSPSLSAQLVKVAAPRQAGDSTWIAENRSSSLDAGDDSHPPLALQARDVIQRTALLEHLPQPARVGATRLQFHPQPRQGIAVAEFAGVRGDDFQCFENVLFQTLLRLRIGVDDAALDTVAAGLEAVVAVDHIDVA